MKYRVSQEVFLENDQDYPRIEPEVFDIRKVTVLNLPKDDVLLDSNVEFVINNQNSVRGNIEVYLITPSSAFKVLPLRLIDTVNYLVSFQTKEIGIYSIYIKCNDQNFSNKPLTFRTTDDRNCDLAVMPKFNSNVDLVTMKGLGLSQIILNAKNIFTVDASAAGDNILFVGICGPKGQQCDEIYIKHMGKNIYNIYYRVHEMGDYAIVIRYGDEHVPGSPISLRV